MKHWFQLSWAVIALFMTLKASSAVAATPSTIWLSCLYQGTVLQDGKQVGKTERDIFEIITPDIFVYRYDKIAKKIWDDGTDWAISGSTATGTLAGKLIVDLTKHTLEINLQTLKSAFYDQAMMQAPRQTLSGNCAKIDAQPVLSN